jgi:PadR family transcriptional regulator PadR
MYSKDLIKGTLSTIILNLLNARGAMYGYEITQAVKSGSSGKYEIREGSLYPALHKMLADGFITAREEQVGRRIRVYYEITLSGRKRLQHKQDELFSFFETLVSLLNPQNSQSTYAQ